MAAYEELPPRVRDEFSGWWIRQKLPNALEIEFGDGTVRLLQVDGVHEVLGHAEYDTHWVDVAVSEPPPAAVLGWCVK